EDGKDGLSPKVTIEENVTDEQGNPGTRIIITPQYRDENGEIRNGHPEETFIKDGKDGKTPTVETEDIIVDGEIVGTKVIVKDGDGKVVSEREIYDGIDGIDGEDGKDGKTPTVETSNVFDADGNITGTRIIVRDGDGNKVGDQFIPNGKNGKDGQSITASVERGEQNGRPGTYVIIRNEDGVELDREFVFDGEDGMTPKVSVQTIERNDGRKTHVVTITNPKTGETQTFTVTDGEKGQPGQAGKDGRDGRDGRDGKNGFTPTIGSNGNWFIAGQDTGVKAKGEDGQSITVTKEVKDEQGNTVVHFSDGSTITISKGDRGETGPAGKDGRDGRDGRDGKDGKDLTGNNGNINIENSNNQSQDQNQTQNQNSNQVVTNNTYNFGDVSLTINQTLNLNGEVVLTKVIVKDKDGLTNETQIDKNTQINQLNVFVNNGQVLVGTFNLTNQNNVKQLLVGNLIINLVINNDSADNPTVPKKPEQPETTPERPSETPDNTPEQPNETPDNTPEQPNETPNVPSTPEETPGQPGETPEAPGTNETPDNTPEQPNETPNVPSTPEGTPGQPGETPEAPGPNETPDNTPEQPNETPNTPTQLSNTPAQPDRSSITGERLPETATDSWMLALASLVSLSSGAVLAVKKKKDDE
ncbi:collagen-flanked surface repeat-containing protein, partial [Dolosigranulum pigrum]